jgi:hypothetical protein
MLQTQGIKRTIDEYQRQLDGAAESRALRIGFGGYAKTGQLADRFAEVHCVDFSTSETAASTRTAELYPNVFTYLVRRPDLQQFATGYFMSVDVAPIPWNADREWTTECLRAAARVLKPGGLLQMQLPRTHVAESELIDLTHRFQLQTLIAQEPAASGSISGLWRRREMGWREELATLAAITGVQVRKISNIQPNIPVAPRRGAYSSISIWVQGLPGEADLFDLDVRVGGVRARSFCIGPPDSKDVRQILLHLPELDQTGLLPVDVFWMEERLGKPGVLRVIEPPPQIPRVISVTAQVGRSVAVVIDDLADPEDFAATVDGRPAWGYDNRRLQGPVPRYEIRFQLPDAVEAGERELALRVGRRHLPPTSLLVAALEPAAVFETAAF